MLRYIFITIILISSAAYCESGVVGTLVERVDGAGGNITFHELSEYLDIYKYQPWRHDDKFYSLITYSEDPVMPEMEAVLSFYEGSLFLIITSSKIDSKTVKSSEVAGGYYIYYYTNDNELIKEYENRYIEDIGFAG